MKAIEVAKEVAEIDADAKINLKRYPRAKSTSEQLEALLNGSVEMNENLSQLSEIMDLPEVQAAIKARQAAKIGNELKAEIEKIQ